MYVYIYICIYIYICMYIYIYVYTYVKWETNLAALKQLELQEAALST